MAHMPTRSCRICRTKKPKAELTRWSAASSGWLEDTTKTAQGRGVYTCSQRCAEILTTKYGKK